VGGDAVGDTFVSIENLSGSIFDDRLAGDAGNNYIAGGAGNDVLYGDIGSDVLNGGDGNDWVYYGNSAAAIAVDLASQNATGGDAAGDTFVSIEHLCGSNFDDSLAGDVGNNYIAGGGGNDTLAGGLGNDALAGGIGNDTLTAGLGNDTFIFTSGFGKDVITDFVSGVGPTDLISFSLGAAFDTFAEVILVATQIGADTIITIDAADTITLSGVQISSLNIDDFIFV
jgi:Ca2+-binding RTX toxin-like protein